MPEQAERGLTRGMSDVDRRRAGARRLQVRAGEGLTGAGSDRRAVPEGRARVLAGSSGGPVDGWRRGWLIRLA